MRWIGTMLLLVPMLLVIQTGCATYTTLTMEGPSDDERVAIGMHRKEVERILETAAASEYDDRGLSVARYEYSDGPPAGSKLRSLIYVAGDLFTLFLSELVFWPIELYADQRIKRVAIAEYDEANKLVEWTIERRNGDRLTHARAPSPREVPPSVAAPGPEEPAEVVEASH